MTISIMNIGCVSLHYIS